MRIAHRSHRKAIRAASINLHRIASGIRSGRGMVPADEPPGYLAAFEAGLRRMARLCEEMRDVSCAGAKEKALAIAVPDGVDGIAHRRAVNALMTMINLHAQRAGLNPYASIPNLQQQGPANLPVTA